MIKKISNDVTVIYTHPEVVDAEVDRERGRINIVMEVRPTS